MDNPAIDRPVSATGYTLDPTIVRIIREFKTALQAIYGNRLRTVVLYGSYVRGDYQDESDIDLMLVLNDEQVDTIAELWNLTDLKIEFLDRYGKIISVLPVPFAKFSTSYMPVYQNVRREGVVL